jgi:lysophospholipase L1-like esterase
MSYKTVSDEIQAGLPPQGAVGGSTASRLNGSRVPSTPERPRSIARYWLIIIVLIEFVLLLGTVELVASFFLPAGHHYRDPQMLLDPDANRVYHHRPNQQAFTIDKPFITNSLGLRDEREIPAEKGDEFRIFALGDSITVGLGVAAEDTYARQLETLLRDPARPLRVVNGGVTGYAVWQEVEVLKEKGRAVLPDVVTLAFYWNDLYPKPDPVVPLATGKSGGVQDPVQRNPYLRMLKRSRGLLFIRERWASLANSQWPTFDWAHREMIYTGGSSPYLEQAFADVRQSLAEFATLRRDGFVPVLLILPLPMQVQQPDQPLTHMQQRIEAMAREVGIKTLDLLPALRRAYAEQPDVYIPWDYEHFTPRGHRVVAEALRQFLLEQHMVPVREGTT